jgi:hypothetical protein
LLHVDGGPAFSGEISSVIFVIFTAIISLLV